MTHRPWPVIAAAALLAACGGGGGGGDDTPPAPAADSFVERVVGLTQSLADDSDPIDIDAIVLTLPEDTDPAPVT
jgi:hypothetical protein